MERTGFTPLFEDVLFTTLVADYSIFKVRQAKRKVNNPALVQREFDRRFAEKEDQQESVDMIELLDEVNAELKRVAEITVKDYLVVFDHKNKQFLIDAERGKAEDCLKHMKTIIEGAYTAEGEDEPAVKFEVYMPLPATMQTLLTRYVLLPDTLPDKIVVADAVKIGPRAPIGSLKSKAANIQIKNQDIHAKEVISHIIPVGNARLTEAQTVAAQEASHVRVHSLGLDMDGVFYFTVDNTFAVTAMAFEESLACKPSDELDAQDQFLAEYTPILPEVSKTLNILYQEVTKLHEH